MNSVRGWCYGLSKIEIKSEGTESIMRFVFIQISLTWVKEKNGNVNLKLVSAIT